MRSNVWSMLVAATVLSLGGVAACSAEEPSDVGQSTDALCGSTFGQPSSCSVTAEGWCPPECSTCAASAAELIHLKNLAFCNPSGGGGGGGVGGEHKPLPDDHRCRKSSQKVIVNGVCNDRRKGYGGAAYCIDPNDREIFEPLREACSKADGSMYCLENGHAAPCVCCYDKE
jgi:hypothetical protein